MRLWDPDDISRLAVVNCKTKETATVYRLAIKQTSDVEEADKLIDTPWMFDLGIDDHTAMSVITGLVYPSSAGAWQFAVDRANWTTGPFGSDTEISVYCRRASKKVSVNPSELEIICNPERIIASQATHVVVAVTYGLEAICLFSHQQNSTSNEEATEKVLNCARLFADCLLDGRSQLDNNEEDGNLQCILYSDLINTKKGPSWTLKSVSEQFEACRTVLDSTQKIIPLKIWLYPLSKLLPIEAGISQNPVIDVSRRVVMMCHALWDRLRRVRLESELLNKELHKLNNWIPKTIAKRLNDFDGLITKFALDFAKTLGEFTISVRRGDGHKEKKMSDMLKAVEKNKSPFVEKVLSQWLNNQRQQIKTLETATKLPGIRFLSEFKQLNKEIKKGCSHAVVLNLPSLAGQSSHFISEMRRFIKEFQSSDPPSRRRRGGKKKKQKSDSDFHSDRRLFFTAVQDFSDWVTDHNSDTNNVKFFVFYNERLGTDFTKTPPFMQLWDGSSQKVLSNKFIIPKVPGQVTVEDNYRGVITLTWTAEERVDFHSYLFQYRSVDGPEEIWKSVQSPYSEITIDFLQSEETYVFRVAIVTQGGKSPFGPVSEEVTIDQICPPPDELQCQYVTDTSISISWNHQFEENDEDFDNDEDGDVGVLDGEHNHYGDEEECLYNEDGNVYGEEDEEYYGDEYYDEEEESVTISSYCIECWVDGHQESTFIQRTTTDKTCTLEPLLPNTFYCIQIIAVCKNTSGTEFYSPASSVLKMKTLKDPERPAITVQRIGAKSNGNSLGIEVYNLPLTKQYRSRHHYVFGEASYSALAGKFRKRTILLLGATGSGKTTLINAMVNYMLDVKWEDDFRFKLIDEPAEKSQALSQTDLITTYDLHTMKGSRLEYSLTVVDTPGFGDTNGFERDKEIMQQIQNYFQSNNGIRQLDAVCFVVQSSLPRLTATQQYIFDSILSIFGQDIKDNIRLMVTFADNEIPPVLEAVKAVGIPSPMDPFTGLPLHHKFNNSIFFSSNKNDYQTDEFSRNYFDMAVEGFHQFFSDLSRMETKSLTQTLDVLKDRKLLKAFVEGIQAKTEMKLTRIDELEKIKKILTANRQQMMANKDFELEVEILVPKSIDISGTGYFTTNCQNCRTTCHFPCSQASDEDKYKCSVIDPNGQCRICNCWWNVHFNQRYRYEMVKEKAKRTSDAIRQQYNTAWSNTLTNEGLLGGIQNSVDDLEKQIQGLKNSADPVVNRLSDIALLPHPISEFDYIDLTIEAEKRENRPGCQQRIFALQKHRQVAIIAADLIQDWQKRQPKPIAPNLQSLKQLHSNEVIPNTSIFTDHKEPQPVSPPQPEGILSRFFRFFSKNKNT